MGFWTENAMEHDTHKLVDCGYVKHPLTREHADKLLTMVGRRNVEIVYCGRVLVRIPPRKLDKVLAAFPDIEQRQTYAWCTHCWPFEGFSSLEYALR